jgi:ATP-dependent DNA helicase RecQ
VESAAQRSTERALIASAQTEVFGLAALRHPQAEAVEAFMAGRDVVVVLGTGAGKSLCFQLPAVVLSRTGHGPTLVVSPLVALMNDQVQKLRALGVAAHALHSGVPWATQRRVLAGSEPAEILFASPERLSVKAVQNALGRLGIARLAVDEAHCITEWGHDFRPEFRELGALREALRVPTMALTATATPKVREDIAACLGLRDPHWVLGSAMRPALRFEVCLPAAKLTRTAWAVQELSQAGFGGKRPPGRALIYALSRRRVQEVQRALRKAGIRAGYYHAGRTEGARASAHAAFAAGKTPVLVATSAYGMGVDLPDVRLVLHVESPETLETYVQQAGRAGRNGEAARCVLAYSAADEHVLSKLRGRAPTAGEQQGRAALAGYALTARCRQQHIAMHFGETDAQSCGGCDVCADHAGVAAVRAAYGDEPKTARPSRPKARVDAATPLHADGLATVVAFVDALKKPVGRRLVAKGLRGSKARDVRRLKLTDNPHFGALAAEGEESLFAAFDALLAQGLLVKKGVKYPTLWVAGKGVRPRTAKPSTPRVRDPLRSALLALRSREAKERRVKAYQVFPNRTLLEMCRLRPQNETALLGVWGLGDERVRRYGRALVDIIRQHAG